MERHQPSEVERSRSLSQDPPFSRDEAIGFLVALACAACCTLFLLSLPTPALAEEPAADAAVAEATAGDAGDSSEAWQLGEQLGEQLAEELTGTVSQPAPAPSNPMPLIIVVAIMGVALAIAFFVSRSHAKPQKIGGMKGDVW